MPHGKNIRRVYSEIYTRDPIDSAARRVGNYRQKPLCNIGFRFVALWKIKALSHVEKLFIMIDFPISKTNIWLSTSSVKGT